MISRKELNRTKGVPTPKISISDKGDFREVSITGAHRSLVLVEQSRKYRTQLPLKYLNMLKFLGYKEWFANEMLRSTDDELVYLPLKRFVEGADIPLEGEILDFGCGTGSVLNSLARLQHENPIFRKKKTLKLYGVDIDPKKLILAKVLLKSSKYKNKAKIYRMKNTGILDFPNEKFNLIIVNAVYEHFLPSERESLCREFQRVLKPGGKLILWGTPNSLWPVEFHTTGLPFINYFPLKVSHFMARKFSSRISLDESLKKLFEEGSTWYNLVGAEKITSFIRLSSI